MIIQKLDSLSVPNQSLLKNTANAAVFFYVKKYRLYLSHKVKYLYNMLGIFDFLEIAPL